MTDEYLMNLTAEKAREIQENTLDESMSQTLKDIMTKIRDTVLKKSNNYIWYYETLENRIIDKLEKLGYSLENQSNQREGTCYKISW